MIKGKKVGKETENIIGISKREKQNDTVRDLTSSNGR